MTYRCSVCALDWKYISANKKCHACGEETWANKKGVPMSDAEAMELGGLDAIGKKPQTPTTQLQNENLLNQFRRWLDTVSPSDFDFRGRM